MTTLGYSANGISLGLEVSDDDGETATLGTVNTVSLGYTMGAIGISYDVDDQDDQEYDAKVTYTMGNTVLSAGTDESESHYAGISTIIGGLSLTARSEADGSTASGVTGENELSVSYTMGALTVAYAKDTGDEGLFGDEAETLTTITYDLGGITLVAKGNDQDETKFEQHSHSKLNNLVWMERAAFGLLFFVWRPYFSVFGAIECAGWFYPG